MSTNTNLKPLAILLAALLSLPSSLGRPQAGTTDAGYPMLVGTDGRQKRALTIYSTPVSGVAAGAATYVARDGVAVNPISATYDMTGPLDIGAAGGNDYTLKSLRQAGGGTVYLNRINSIGPFGIGAESFAVQEVFAEAAGATIPIYGSNTTTGYGGFMRSVDGWGAWAHYTGTGGGLKATTLGVGSNATFPAADGDARIMGNLEVLGGTANFTKSQNNGTRIAINNTAEGAASATEMEMDVGSGGGSIIAYPTSYADAAYAGRIQIVADSGMVNGLRIDAEGDDPIVFLTNDIERARIDSALGGTVLSPNLNATTSATVNDVVITNAVTNQLKLEFLDDETTVAQLKLTTSNEANEVNSIAAIDFAWPTEEAAVERTWGRIIASSTDNTNGAEYGVMVLQVMEAGALGLQYTFAPSALTLPGLIDSSSSQYAVAIGGGVGSAMDYVEATGNNAANAPLVSVNGVAPAFNRAFGMRSLYTTTSGAVNVGAGEDDLESYTMPASTMALFGDYISVKASFSIAANANSKRIRGYIDGTLFYDSSAQIQNGGTLIVDARLARGSTTALNCSTVATNAAAVPLFTNPAQYVATTKTFTNALIVKFTAEAVSNADITQNDFQVEFHPGIQ